MSNELKQVEQTEEAVVVSETKDYIKVYENGKYRRKAKYQQLNSMSHRELTDEEEINIFNLLNGAEGSAVEMKRAVGSKVTIVDFITVPYTKIDEDTGVEENGVLTYLINENGEAIATSSKAVYFTLNRLLIQCGKHADGTWKRPIVEIISVKQTNGDGMDLKLVGFDKKK
ncbi:single strand DNA binding protein [Bacillus phage GA1]|uniref:Single-stranded DNA-binding protein n=1 Tax=Bacillus phage GA-1 TaxID=2679898 RepID=SSB_BPGA1|nr:single strand DNA binding protein [Bacillus phage GA1]Q9MCD0.1 RecName: Full=Single-stranded DNA-binding protein; Short=SSB; AltName: Full=Gene product 5; Short=gp5; AltName: Full=Protein p5 [Bacillus phage GA1]CAC21526.1 SSB [Bacillus phage GA1]